MAYTPNNLFVYLSAYSGCLSGLGAEGKYLSDPLAGDQYGYARMANAFAKEVDVVWQHQVGLAPDSLQADTISAISEAVWENRSPLVGADPLNPGNYYGVARGIVALVLEGSLVVASEGIAVPPAGGGGGFAGSWVAITNSTGDGFYSWDPNAVQKIYTDTNNGAIAITMTVAPPDNTVLVVSSTGVQNTTVTAPDGWQIFDPQSGAFGAVATLSTAMLVMQSVVSSPAALAHKLVPISAF